MELDRITARKRKERERGNVADLLDGEGKRLRCEMWREKYRRKYGTKNDEK